MMARIKELISSELAGKVKQIKIAYCYPVFSGNNMRYKFELGGGAIMDAGSAAISCVRYLLDEEPTEVTNIVTKNASEFVEEDAKFTLSYASGTVVYVDVSIFTLIPRVTLEIQGENNSVIQATNWAAPHFLYNSLRVQDSAGCWREEKFSRHLSTFDYEFRIFVEAIRTSNHKVITDPEFAVSVQKTIDDVYNTHQQPLRGTIPPSAYRDDAGKPKEESIAAKLKARKCF